MTLFVLVVSAFLAAWGHAMADISEKLRQPIYFLIARTIYFAFLALAIGAGIQFTFKG